MTTSPFMGSIHSNLTPPQNISLQDEVMDQELEAKLAELENLGLNQEALNGQETDADQSGLPEIDFSQFIPLNPIFDDKFSSMTPLLNIAKTVFGPIAFQNKMFGPALAILGASLGWGIDSLIPGAIGLGLTATSGLFTKAQVKQIIDDPSSYKSNLEWMASKTWTCAKAALGAYSVLSGVGMLSAVYSMPSTVGLLTSMVSIGSGLVSLYTSDSSHEEQTKSSTLGYIKNAGKVGAIAYGTIAGLGAMFGIGNLPGIGLLSDALSAATQFTSHGSLLCTGLSQLVVQNILKIGLTLGLTLGMQIMFFKITGSAFESINKEIKQLTSSNKYGPYLERIEALSQEEYHELITSESGMDFEEIKGAFEPLRSRDPEFPENAAKPVIARLMVLNEELNGKGGAMEKYRQFIESNKLEEANNFLNKELKIKLITQVYLKHCLVMPTRPELGKIEGSEASQEYFSYVSHLVGTPVKFPLNQIEPGKIQEDAHEMFMKENAIQQQYYMYKLMQQHGLLNHQEKADS